MSKNEESIIKMKNVHKSYYLSDNTEIPVLKWLNITIKRGEFVALMWESGWWKSTLLNILWFLHPMTSGYYEFIGEDISHFKHDNIRAFIRSRKIWFIFQQYYLLSRLTALENVMLPGIYANISYEERYKRAKKYLKEVGLSDKEKNKPSELSGGQQQRVAIARALINEPDLILADEPTWALDSTTSAEIMDLIANLNKQWKTVVMVTHTLEMARYANRIIFLEDGKVTNRDYRPQN